MLSGISLAFDSHTFLRMSKAHVFLRMSKAHVHSLRRDHDVECCSCWPVAAGVLVGSSHVFLYISRFQIIHIKLPLDGELRNTMVASWNCL